MTPKVAEWQQPICSTKVVRWLSHLVLNVKVNRGSILLKEKSGVRMSHAGSLIAWYSILEPLFSLKVNMFTGSKVTVILP